MSVLPAGRNKQLTRSFLRPVGLFGLALLILSGALAPARAGAAAMKTVRYHGYTARVPASWPVYHLNPGSRTCVRFDRHAVYLGTPSSAQRCPGHAAGRTEAILISPQRAVAHGGFAPQLGYAPARTATAQGRETQITSAAHGVTVTATWNRVPQIIRGALHVSALTSRPTATPAARLAQSAARFQTHARVAQDTGTVFTGPGFDACSTPSQNTMSAWGSSPYRALAVYVGGANSACAQPNLNTTWMQTQWSAGWHVVPIYVGLQAPSNSCGCAAMTSSQASAEGTAAAQDAVTQAQAVGIGAGNPIYNDMEGYNRTSANTNAVMNFLAAWTTLNIDSDYLDGATAYGGTTAGPAASPSLSVSPTATGTINLAASWPGQSGVSSWQTLGGSNPNALSPLGASPVTGATTPIAQHSAFPYYAVEAMDANGQVIGTSATVTTRPHVVLYGRSAFVPRTGVTGVPAGCFTGAACALSVTVTSGRTLVARTGAERLNTSGGLVFFTLNAKGTRLLAHARGRRLPVRITIRDVSGRSASTLMNLIPYTTVGSGPRRSATPASTLRVVGLRDFVWRNATGGILAGCSGSAPCLIKAKISAGRQTVATTLPEFLGANSAGYLSYRLTAYGRSLIAKARGNQLGALVTLTTTSAGTGASSPTTAPATTTATARAHISLSGYR